VSADVLAHVPGCERGEPPASATPLAARPCHRRWRVRTREGQYVVRVTLDAEPAPGLDASQEALLQGFAARGELAPRVIWADPVAGTLITEYVSGRVWTRENMADPQKLRRLGMRLRALHTLSAPPLPPLDVVATARRYRAAIRAPACAERAQCDAWLAGIEVAAPLIATDSRPPSIIHGDLHHTNIVDSTPLVLIDWEYAAVADPLFDLACLLAYYPEARIHSLLLLEVTGLGASANEEMLLRAARLYESLNALWTRAVTAALSCGAPSPESAD
jgi:aminoglycoside phosphotransferase (APT) family kinase protein